MHPSNLDAINIYDQHLDEVSPSVLMEIFPIHIIMCMCMCMCVCIGIIGSAVHHSV